MKVQLVLPQEEGYQQLVEGWWLPLGLLSLGTHLKETNPDTEVEILDARHSSNREVSKKLDADIIGFGPSITSYKPALRMAQEIKDNSPETLTVFGGAYVTPMSGMILMNRPQIDAIVKYDGEKALEIITQNKGVTTDAPNLTFTGGFGSPEKIAYFKSIGIKPIRGPITKTPDKKLNIRELSFPDISLLQNLEEYWKDFWKTYPQYNGQKIVSTAAQRGCPYRASKAGGCFFCSRVDSSYRAVDPSKYAKYIKGLENKFGISIIEEGSDDFIANTVWLRKFADAYKANNLSVVYRMFGRADAVTPKSIGLLNRINTQSVFIGYESGDPYMLKTCNKGLSLESALQATRLLIDNGIDVVGAFILGFPGENKQSIQNTINFAQKVYDEGVKTISSAILTPMPPSPAWKHMRKNPIELLVARKKNGIKNGTDYGSSDILDPIELQRDFVNMFCEVSYPYIQEKFEELRNIGEVQTPDFSPITS